MSQKFQGIRTPQGCIVTVVETVPAPASPDFSRRSFALPHVVYHSPTGFEWGYAGSGPADLALSILAFVLGERQTKAQARRFNVDGVPRAWALHQRFKREVIAGLPQHGALSWELDAEKVRAWAHEQEALLAEKQM